MCSASAILPRHPKIWSRNNEPSNLWPDLEWWHHPHATTQQGGAGNSTTTPIDTALITTAIKPSRNTLTKERLPLARHRHVFLSKNPDHASPFRRPSIQQLGQRSLLDSRHLSLPFQVGIVIVFSFDVFSKHASPNRNAKTPCSPPYMRLNNLAAQ